MPISDIPASQSGPKIHVLTFRLDDRQYAVPAEEVAEVIRIPRIVRLPQSPKGLLGLANLRGAVLPVASGRGLLGQQDGGDAINGRAIVLNDAAHVAFAVDAVTALLQVEESAIETRESELATLPGETLTGAFRPSAGGPVVKLLDIKSLLKTAFTPRERSQRQFRRTVENTSATVSADVRFEISKFVAFAIAGQEYALPLSIVQEIVAAPAMLADVPHSEDLVLGVTSHRDKLLPLMSLRGLLGFGLNADTVKEKMVIVSVNGSLVGLVVDEMRAIFASDQSRIDPMPTLLAARTGGESRVAAIYRGDGVGGRGLISILSPEQIFGDDVMQRVTEVQNVTQSAESPEKPAAETQQFLVFKLGDEEFGLPISTVEEVARVPEKISRVPNTPKFLEGVVNLRGEIVPVVDQRARFHMSALAEGASRRLIVVRTERNIAGLIVDSVSEVLRTTDEDIEVAPDLTGEGTRLVKGVVNLVSQSRMVLLLDPTELLTRAERGLLDKFSKQQKTAGRSEA